MMADVITKNNNGRYKEEKKRNRRVSDPRVSTINGNQINGHVLVVCNSNNHESDASMPVYINHGDGPNVYFCLSTHSSGSSVVYNLAWNVHKQTDA